MLVYPFEAGAEEFEKAAMELTEVHDLVNADINQGTQDRQRAHYVTVHVEDYALLNPRKWLNDALLDFWMQW